MPLESGDAASLWDMFTAAKGLVASLKDVGLEEYRANGELRLTVERRIEIIGEAARRLSPRSGLRIWRYPGAGSSHRGTS